MELLCSESQLHHVPRAVADSTMLQDDRVLDRMLSVEDRYTVTCNYFKHLQSEVQPKMRKILALWMSEVCEEQNCEDVVFPQAMNYLDRFLSQTNIQKSQLQLLGAVCLLLASKFRQCRPLSAETLVYYTDYSVTIEEIMAWELLVLGRLKWDMSSVLPNDFIDHLLSRLPFSKETATVRRHASTFISICATDFKFSSYSPSLLATASVAAAVSGLSWTLKDGFMLSDAISFLQQITGIESKVIYRCVEEIEDLMAANIACHQQQTYSSKLSNMAPCSVTKSSPTSTNPSGTNSQPETPTDIQDINF